MNLTEQQLVRAIYSLWDFQQALSALTFLTQECDFDNKYNKVDLRRFKCFETTAIISISRPLGTTRSGIQLGLRGVGIIMNDKEKLFVKKILNYRDSIVAHSTEDEMHFRISTFEVDGGIRLPYFQFNEGLLLSQSEALEMEKLLLKFKNGLTHFFFSVAQKTPDLLEKYKEPLSYKVTEPYNSF